MLIIFLGLIVAIYLLVCKRCYLTYTVVSMLTLGIAGLGLLISSVWLVLYNTILPFNYYFVSGWFGGIMVLDGIGLLLVWLTIFIVFLCSLYSYNVVGFSYRITNGLMLIMSFLLIMAFTVRNLLEFYLYFEAILVPMVGLILLGSRGRKIHAMLLFFFIRF